MILIVGLLMGRLRLSHQLDSSSRLGSDANGSVQPPGVCVILYRVLTGYYTLHADLIRRIPACPVQ